ncbi:MAG TPA: UDP-3-O-(3-hydroxymyristoyl)glucosamine N-acyltransferase [Verrucomicrobiales bacterium]|nr:UDP-3-O-(3-hydroxymyristoyl)glucosamine N-acyltransferase [Verrucomicrobiales bacterium]
MELTAETIARHLNGEVIGDGKLVLTGFAPATTAKPGDLTFAENASFFAKAEATEAAAVLVDQEYPSARKTLIRVQNSRIAFAQALPLFFPEPTVEPGIHPTAVIAKSARVDSSVHVGAHCVIGDQCVIGPRSILHPRVTLGPNAVLGEECVLHPGVTVYHRCQLGNRVAVHAGTVIGSDGFGYVFDKTEHRKVPQVGNVIIHDDVEIGANVTIDRGTLGPTVIGRGSKIDNLVQVAHNVQIGEHVIIIAQVGVAGSTRVGNHTQIGGQVGIAGHLKIGDHAQIAAQSGVMHDIPDGEKWFGSPAQPDRKTKRVLLAINQLPRLLKRVSELEHWVRGKSPRGDSDRR